MYHAPIIPLSFASAIFFFNAPPPTEIYTLSLHDALPIYVRLVPHLEVPAGYLVDAVTRDQVAGEGGDHRVPLGVVLDRKSTRLNSSHPSISYAVFCLKKKKRLNHPM